MQCIAYQIIGWSRRRGLVSRLRQECINCLADNYLGRGIGGTQYRIAGELSARLTPSTRARILHNVDFFGDRADLPCPVPVAPALR